MNQLGYEKVVPVASGGMASVWTARRRGAPRGFAKIVALKTMLPELAQEAEYRTMFLDEVRVASRLSHPNVCETFDAGEDESGELFLVMEWIDGVSLHRLLKPHRGSGAARPIPPRAAARIVSDACAGLHAAHESVDTDGSPLAVVHRDVSPQNLLVGADGRVKVTDFGIASARGKQHATLAGQAKGKIAYMAPEQLKSGASVDRRTDVFALGSVLYEMTTGRKPFDGESEIDVLRRILEATPPAPRTIVPDYPAELERIVARAMAKDPADRFASAEGLRLALSRWAEEHGGDASDREIADLVEARCGDELRERRARIQAAHAAETVGAGDSVRPAKKDRFRRGLVALGFAVVALGAGSVARSELAARQAAPVAEAAPPAAPAASAASAREGAVATAAPSIAPLAENGIVVRTEPRNAELLLDGEPVRQDDPAVPIAPRPAAGEFRVLVVKAPGFVDRLLLLDESTPATVEISLSPASPTLVSTR